MQRAMQAEDLHQRIINQIICAIETGASDYQMPCNPKLYSGPAISLSIIW